MTRLYAALLAASLLPACHGSKNKTDDSGEPGDDTGEEEFPDDFVSVSATVTDNVATVVRVAWETTSEAEGRVEFGETTDYEHTTPVQGAATAQEVLLLGLPPDTDVHYRVVATVDGEEISTEDRQVTTGSLPNTLPALDITGELDGWLIVPFLGTARGVVILDSQGRIVWYWVIGDEYFPTRSFLARDASELLFNDYALEGGGVLHVGFDGTEEYVTVEGTRHDFAELPDGTIGVLAADTRTYGPKSEEAVGDCIVEISTDGTQTTLWSSWDSYEPSEICPDLDCLDDWAHANALDYDETEDAYYINMHRVGGIAKIARSTGTLEWVLAGDFSDFEFIEDSPEFELSHQFELSGSQIVVFDNGNYGAESAIRSYEIDFDAMTVLQTWEYSPDDPVDTTALGLAEFWDDGAIFANWGSGGMLQVIDSNGDVSWQVVSDLGYVFGYSHHVDDLYTAW